MEDLLVTEQDDISLTELCIDRILDHKWLYEYRTRLCVKECA